jgi:hypothetical protein
MICTAPPWLLSARPSFAVSKSAKTSLSSPPCASADASIESKARARTVFIVFMLLLLQ